MMSVLKVADLNELEFADYGQIISEIDKQPIAQNNDFTYWDKLVTFFNIQETSIGILRVNKRDFNVDTLEYHLNTPEIIMALDCDSIIVVGKAIENTENIKAFKLPKGQGVALGKGILHWAPYPIEKMAGRFLIIFAADTPNKDTYLSHMDKSIRFEI
ncbi:DUF4867 family protein [Thermoanaerobacteraceae bacterium SP2]|jgi:ureidoglycolate hydrolase|nr:ureidoglycolate lyase [Petrotoga sp.]RKL63294.1 DUF4867 family protein [Thermoanaerobacteraceae bacterium SP2]